jgi:DNA primase
MRTIDDFLHDISSEYYIPIIYQDINPKKSGSVWKALCPFHSENTPSFIINNKENVILYRCFGCGNTGNSIQFFERHYQLSFKEALNKLSNVTSVPLPDEFLNEGKTAKIVSDFEILHENLINDRVKTEHIKSRGVKDLSIFGLDNDVYKILSRHHNTYHLIDYRPATDTKYKFPSGFRKHFPFNFHKCRGDDIYITEGIFDALNLHEIFGLNACSILGTELMNKTINLLKRFKNVILVLDNDNAGYSATERVIRKLYSNGFMNVFYVDYRDFEYKDLNEAVQNSQSERVKDLLTRNIREGVHFTIEKHKSDRLSCQNDLEEVKTINDFANRILLYPDLVREKILSLYEKTFENDLHSLVDHYKGILTIDEFKSELTEIIDTKQFDADTIKQIESLAMEKSSSITHINLKTSELLKEDLRFNYIKSSLINDIRYYESTLNTVAARTSHGKTSFLLNEAVNWANEKHEIAFIILEDTAESILSQMFINHYNKNIAATDSDYINRDTYFKNRKDFNDFLREIDNIYVVDDAFSIEEIEKYMIYLKTQKDISIIFLDYLQLIKVNDKQIRKNQRQEQIKYINDILLKCAMKYGLYLIVGSQMNRKVDKKDDIFSDNAYREAGDIEQDSFVIINLWNNQKNKDNENTDNSLFYYVAKNRRGKSGMTGDLIFNPEYTILK